MTYLRSSYLAISATLCIWFTTTTQIMASDSHVGDIRYSILSEAQFQTLHGKEWELLNGQELPLDSELKQFWTDSHLPDARGVFLRGANYERNKDEGNPDGSLSIGKYQEDQLKSHLHNVKPVNGGLPFISRAKGSCELQNGLQGGDYFHDFGVAGITRDNLQTDGVGGQETRPRNITVNVFIKLKETPKKPKSGWSQEQITELLNKPEFKNALEDAIRNFRRSVQ